MREDNTTSRLLTYLQISSTDFLVLPFFVIAHFENYHQTFFQFPFCNPFFFSEVSKNFSDEHIFFYAVAYIFYFLVRYNFLTRRLLTSFITNVFIGLPRDTSTVCSILFYELVLTNYRAYLFIDLRCERLND